MLVSQRIASLSQLTGKVGDEEGRTIAASAAFFAASASLRAFFSTSSEISRVDASALAHWAVVSQASLEPSGRDWIGFSEDIRSGFEWRW
jgi:hypothetical protein